MTDEHDGEEPSFHYVQSPTTKRVHLVGKGQLNASLKPRAQGRSGHFQQSTATTASKDDKRRTSYDSGYGSPPPVQTAMTGQVTKIATITHANGTEGALENPHSQPRLDKSGNTRSKQRARKLQLGDLDWYGRNNNNHRPTAQPPATTISLDSYVVDKRARPNSGAAVDRTRPERTGSEAQQQQANGKKSG